MTNDVRLFPAIVCGSIFLCSNTGVGNKNIDRSALRFKIIGECLHRCKVCMVQAPHLRVCKPGLILDRCGTILVGLRHQGQTLKKVYLQQLSCFSTLLQAKINLADFVRAKYLAASNPSPELAPVMSTVFPERLAVRSGGAAFLWCIKYSQMDGLVMIMMIREGYAFGLECLGV